MTLEIRDEQGQTRLSVETGFRGLKDRLGALSVTLAAAAVESVANHIQRHFQ